MGFMELQHVHRNGCSAIFTSNSLFNVSSLTQTRSKNLSISHLHQKEHTMRFIAILALCATPAFAVSERMTLLPGDGRCFAIVEIENLHGTYNHVEHLETERGTVSIQYETVGGHNPTDHDLIDVVDLPPNVAAHPMHISLPDGDFGHVCLMVYVGM